MKRVEEFAGKHTMRTILIRFLAFFVVWMAADSYSDTVLYEGDSLYHHIRVSEQNGIRYLSFNRTRGSQSAVDIKNHYKLQFAYTKASFVVPAFLDRDPGRILYVGLGAGSMPRVMAKIFPKARIDMVEIDPDVVKAAKQYFFFQPTTQMRIFPQDGRQFLRRSRDRYDIIFLDAYNDHAIPFHLTTQEFLTIVKEKLTPNGVMASNIWGPRSDGFYQAEVKTIQQVFPRLYFIDSISTNNYILVAPAQNKTMTRNQLMERVAPLQKRYRFSFDLANYARTFEDLSKTHFDAKVLLDDFAPVETLRSKRSKY